MIEELQVKNLGVIEKAKLSFSPGLTVLTGETGAGKSMVLSSLKLLLGSKADTNLVREGSERIEIDGLMRVPEGLRNQLDELAVEFDEGDCVIISRTVSKGSRGRIIVGGRPLPLKVLSEVVGSLVTIHGQSDQWRMRQTSAQKELLDEYAGKKHQHLLKQYQDAWKEAVEAKKHLDQLLTNYDQQQIEIEYLRELIERIDQLQPQEGEEQSLQSQINRLDNALELQQLSESVSKLLSGSEQNDGVIDMMQMAQKTLDKIASRDPNVTDLAQKVGEISNDIQVVCDDIEYYASLLSDDPAELSRLHNRKSQLDELMRGRAKTAVELHEWNEGAKKRLYQLTEAANTPQEAEAKLEAAQKEVLRLGEALSDSRKVAAERLAKVVNEELPQLEMKNATFSVQFHQTKPKATGLEEIELYLQPHEEVSARPLAQSASGGELSRVMLALEIALGRNFSEETFVFDEVDAGIGGRTALAVGEKLAELAKRQQVIAVTHLPQIAAKAQKHLVIEKNNNSTQVKEVQGEERIDEIIRMMGSHVDSSVARRHAMELLGATDEATAETK